MKIWFCCGYRIRLIGLVLIGLSGLARAQQGTYYDGPTTLVDMRPYGFSYSAYAHDTRLWIPNDVTVIRGVIILGNGAGGDERGRTGETDWQALARAHGFALMGTRGYVCYRSAELVDKEVQILLSDLAWYATDSGHPEVAHLPFVLAGWSGGGQMANGINTNIPERVIAFIANKGSNYLAPSSAASLKTPSILVAGQLDGQTNHDGITNLFRNNRPSGALWADAFEQNTGHNEGNVDGMFFTFFDHAIRARYPAGATPLSGPVTLLDLTESNGWLATEPTVSSGLSGSVYPYADYPGTKTTACWLMDADVANLYRGFATYNPAVTVTTVGGPLFSASQEIEFRVAVDSNAFPNWTFADVYDGAVKLGTVTRGQSMSVRAVRPWGGRGVTAIARDSSGNERTSIPQPFVANKNAAAAWNNGAGDFLWNTTSTNWGGAVWTSGADAVFGATGVGTVTVSGTQTLPDSLTALIFDTAGYKLMGGTLALPANPGIAGFNVNADAEIASVISGSGGLTKTGAGTLTLTGSNTHTGMTAVKAGSLKLGNGGNLSNTQVFPGATVAIAQNANGTTNALNGYLLLWLGANLTMVDGYTSTLNVGYALLSAQSGASPALTFDVASTNQTSDRLAISGTASIFTDALPTIVTNFLAAPSDSTKTYTLITAASGLGGAAKFKLAPRNFMIGGSPYRTSLATSTDTAVILSFEAGATIPPFYWQGSIDASWKSQNSGTLNTNFTSEAAGVANTFELPSSVSDVFMTAGSASNLTTTLDQAFTINGLTFTGTGSSNTAGSSIGAGSGGTLQINNGGITVNAGSGANTISAPVTLGAAQSWTNNSTNLLTLGTGAVNNGGFPLTVAGSGNMAITGAMSGNGSLTQSGSGTLTLSGNSTYTGNTTIRSGNLSVANDVNLGNGGGIILNGGTLQTTGSSAFSSSRAISVTGNNTIDASNTAGTTLTGLVTGLVTGASALTKTGSGSLTFSPGLGNTDTLVGFKLTSGQVNINSGAFNITGSGWQDATQGLWLNGGNLNVAGGALSTTGNVVNENGTLTVSSGTYTSNGWLINAWGGNATTTVSGGLLDINGGLRVSQGIGTVNLDGGTVKLQVFQCGSGVATGTVNFNGATMVAKANTSGFTQTYNTTYNVKSGGAIIDTAGFNITAAADLLADSPSGGLTKNGAGTLTLTGNSTYTGATTINAGALSVSTDVNLGNGGGIILNGGTLQTTGSSAFSSSRAISVTGNSTIDASNTAGTTLTGLVTGGSALTKTGSGSLTFSPGVGNTDTLVGFKLTSGQVNINSGAFNITGSGWQDATQGLWLNGGNLNVAGGALSTTGNVVNENGTLTVSSGTYTSNGWLINAWGGNATTTVSGGLLDINGGLRVSQGIGTVNLDGGTVKLREFQCGNGVATGTVNFNGAIVVAKASVAGFTQTYNTTYNVKSGGAIIDTAGFNITAAANLLAGSPSGGLTKNGTGTLTLTGNSTYTGATTINAGTLQLDGSVAGNLTVQSGGRLIGSGTVQGNLTVASGGIVHLTDSTFTVNGSITNNGLIILSNGAHFTGTSPSFVNNGTLDITNAGTFTPPPGFENNGVILDAISNPSVSAPVISSVLSLSETQGKALSYQISGTNSPTSFGASNLPVGLYVNSTTGLISGTPSAIGTTAVTISASNAQGTGTDTLMLTVNRASLPPTFINTGSDTFVASAVVTASPYNADPTGVTDATNAIQKAINAVGELNGGVVYLPAGRYRLNGSLALPYGVILAGANNGTAETLLLAYYGQGKSDSEPLINAWGGEGGVIGLSVFYPAQSPSAPVPYAATIGGVFIATVNNVTLYNSYHGIAPAYLNAVCISNVKGTVLHAGIIGEMSTEFSWMHDVVFSPQFWIDAAAALTGSAMTSSDQAALTAYVAANCTGLELQRIDGLSIMRYSAEGSRIPVLLRPNPLYNNGANGFGGVVSGWPASRKEVSWDPWYYGMHYVNIDKVPEASASTYTFAVTPLPAKVDAGSFFNVTSPPYNAVGNGVVDDTAAIVSALSAAAAHGGGTVYIPQGKYKVTSPFTVPAGVELRGAMGAGKVREGRESCTLYAYCGQGSANPTTDTALITLAEGSGVRGFSIAYPEQSYDVSKLVTYPYAIRGAGSNVWAVDMMIVNACYGIDLASNRCDNHLVRGLWATAYYNGISVGGGSVNGVLERICFSYGPVLEWPMAQAQYNSALQSFWETNCTAYQFGEAVGEKAWGLNSFNSNLHFKFSAIGGGMQNAQFWHTMHDVGHRANILCEGGADIKFFGYFGTGSGRGVCNWLEVASTFEGPIEFYGKTIQQPFINHPYDFTDAQVVFHDEMSLTEGKSVSASAGSDPANVVDRNPRTLWTAPSGSTLTIDLGAVKVIDRFAIENAGLFSPKNLNTTVAQLNVSVDGVSFVKAGQINNGSYPLAWYDVPLTPIQARYVQLAVTGSGADNTIRVASFQVFESNFSEPMAEWRNNSGNFLWDASSPNWSGRAWAPGDSAVFGTTGVGTINLSGSQSVGTDNGSLSTPAMIFNAPGYKLTGGALFLPSGVGSNSTIVVNANTEIDSLINVGNGTLTIAGSSMLTLNPGAGNTDTLGRLNLDGSGISFKSGIFAMSSLVNDGSSIVNFDGGTLKATTSNNRFIDPVSLASSCFVQSGSAIFDTAGFDVTVLANLLAGSPSGGLTKNGAGTLTFTGNNTYTGSTTINAGTLSVSTDANLGNGGSIMLNGGTLQTTGSSAFSSSRAISVTGNSTIDASNTAGTTLTGLVTGGSALTKTGSGNLTFSPGVGNTDTLVGFKLTSGQVNINSGAFNITGTEVQSSTSGLWLNGGNLTVAGGALSTTGYVTLQTGTLTVSSGTYVSNQWLLNGYGGTATTTVSGGLIDIGGIRVSQGVGTVNLDGGTIKLSQFQSVGFTGTVNFNGASVLARANATDFTQTANTTYNVKSGGAIFDTAGFNITAAADLLAGAPSGGLTKNGVGTLTLTGTNTYTGATTINAGTLSVSTDVNLGSGGAITLNGGTLQTTGSSAFSSSRAITVTGNSEIDASNTAGTTLTGLVTGGSALTKKGGGSLTFSSGVGNTNTLAGLKLTSGQVNINSGGLNITGTGVQSSASGLWLDGGNLTVAGGALSSAGHMALQNGMLTVSSGTYISNAWLLNAYGGTATTTVSGGLSDIGGIRVSQGVGTVNLDGGTIKLSQFQSVGFTGTVNFNGATVLARADATDFTQTANTTYNVKAGGAIFDTAGFNITAAANLRAGSPSGGLTKNGAGTLTLTGNNTYTGLTNVTAGTLQLDGSVASNLTVQAGGRLIGSGSIGGNLTVASGGIAQFSGGTFAVNGSITNTGLVILSNGARFTGTSSSFVNNGTLDVINAGTFTPPQGFQNNGVIIDANSVRVTSVSRSGNNVTVRINSNTGHTYQLQHSPTLNGGSFVNIGLPQTGSTGTILEFTASSSAGSGFYRVAVNP